MAKQPVKKTQPSKQKEEALEESAEGEATNPAAVSTDKVRDLSKVGELYSLVRESDEEEIKQAVSEHLEKLAGKFGQYLVLYLFDPETSIGSYHSNKIYDAAAGAAEKRNILLIVQSGGGRIEPAYLISKTCKRLSKDKFVVAVPRRAKSAATLLALGADEIHMGLMSELGPIDPQINGYPALGLTNALNKVAELSAKFPESSHMWSQYLGARLDLNDIGYFDRVTESAAQYAERLMNGKSFGGGQTAASLANHFVNHYKDHGFVIDYDEALALMGANIVKTGSAEYEFSNEVYQFLDLLELFLSAFKKKAFAVIGSANGIVMRDKGN